MQKIREQIDNEKEAAVSSNSFKREERNGIGYLGIFTAYILTTVVNWVVWNILSGHWAVRKLKSPKHKDLFTGDAETPKRKF